MAQLSQPPKIEINKNNLNQNNYLMRKIISPLKSKIGELILILICLIIEAYCLILLPEYTAKIVDIGIKNTNIPFIIDTGTMMLLLIGISTITEIACSYLSSRVSSGYAKDLRKLVYEKILKFSNNELNHISKASLITRTTNDIGQIQNITLVLMTTMVFAPILGIGSIIKVFNIGTDLSWIILIAFIIILTVLILITLKVVPEFNKLQEFMDDMNRATREILIGMPVIKAFVRQDFEREKFEKINKKYLNLIIHVYKELLFLQPIFILTLNLMIVAIIYIGAYEIMGGTLLTGDLIAFIQYATQIVIAFTMIGSFMVSLPRIVTSANRVNEILETELTILDGEIDEIIDKPTIEFKNVSYKHPQSEIEAIKNINLKLEPGKTLGIIGGTGSGKSTILHLIPRLQDPTSGEILINGENIKNFKLETLREKISLTPQKAQLMQGTVKSNMIIGKHDATDEEIENALEKAQVNFIDDLNDEVAQGGSNFSGGQKQRLSIARSLMKHHDFYLFDDCFSALDMNTEKLVRNNIKSIPDSSILIVSQRISTIMHADEILVIDNGEIIDRGTHEKLNESCELYKEIVDSQIDTMGGAI